MRTIDIHDAKVQFSKLIEAVSLGEEIIITKAGKPIARLVPIQSQKIARVPGSLKNRISISDDFDASLAEEILSTFHESKY